jgi:hypothetical protein
MNNFLLGQPWALKLVWAVNVQNYTILPGTLLTFQEVMPIRKTRNKLIVTVYMQFLINTASSLRAGEVFSLGWS